MKSLLSSDNMNSFVIFTLAALILFHLGNGEPNVDFKDLTNGDMIDGGEEVAPVEETDDDLNVNEERKRRDIAADDDEEGEEPKVAGVERFIWD